MSDEKYILKKRLEYGLVISIFGLGLLFSHFFLRASVAKESPSAPVYDFSIEPVWLVMGDGIKLSATIYKPVPIFTGEKFPVLFEFLPYRKDDSFFIRDYPLYSYFARRGFAAVKVDIRGTGSSEGALPDREYSDKELHDAVEIIEQLARMPWSNGRVGMWGISWGGFNAIQVAMRQPPSLKAILAIHASDDLYHDDIRYIDGALHIDSYSLEIDHENGLPRTPGYDIDKDYFENRFDSYPWFLAYLRHQVDGQFWREKSLRWQYHKLRIPAYLIGGLLDGYRDSIPRILENARQATVKAVIGPWNHSWPDNGTPGPNYEWRIEAVRWWDHWLKGRKTGVLDDPDLVLFLRKGQGPDMELKTTPGQWISETWPIPGSSWKKFYPAENHQLQNRPGRYSVESLRYIPSYGLSTGYWWGEPTGDMRPDDAGSMVFDSPVLGKSIELAGFPRVFLRVAADAPLAHWAARLEDVNPDGMVSLVTGAILNGSQRDSRLNPQLLEPDKVYNLQFDLHFTTWTYKPGHRIRLAVSNSLFPMIWPTPYPMTTRLYLGTQYTSLQLPVIPSRERRKPNFLPPEPREERKDARYIGDNTWPPGVFELKRDMWRSLTGIEWKSSGQYDIQGNRYLTSERNYYEANDRNPAKCRFRGEASHTIGIKSRTIDLSSSVDMTSDEKYFYLIFIRRIYENKTLVRERRWEEKISRVFQ